MTVGLAAFMDYLQILESVQVDPRYQANLAWGEARDGHPEGSVGAHIAELEQILEHVRRYLSDLEVAKLRLLIHTHDSFKAEASPGVPILDPRSHASIAREFLATYCADSDLLAMVQLHDEPFALWRQASVKGRCNAERFASLLAAVADWPLFLAFLVIDGCTYGKSREPLDWLLAEFAGRFPVHFTPADIPNDLRGGA